MKNTHTAAAAAVTFLSVCVAVCSRLPCVLYGAGSTPGSSPAAVVSSHELVNGGDGGSSMLYAWYILIVERIYTRGHVTSVRRLISSINRVRLFRFMYFLFLGQPKFEFLWIFGSFY